MFSEKHFPEFCLTSILLTVHPRERDKQAHKVLKMYITEYRKKNPLQSTR